MVWDGWGVGVGGSRPRPRAPLPLVAPRLQVLFGVCMGDVALRSRWRSTQEISGTQHMGVPGSIWWALSFSYSERPLFWQGPEAHSPFLHPI